MDKFLKYINYTICDKSVDCFKTTNFVTYRNFCDNMRIAIKYDDINNSYLFILHDITNFINTIYCLGVDESLEHVIDFFIDEKYTIFDEAVMLEREFFKNSFN